MSHQIKRLRCTVLTAGSAGGNFPSAIYAQSSTWGPAAKPAQPGPTAHQAAKVGALARRKPNPLCRRAATYCTAASALDFLTGKAAEAGEIIRFGWPVLDPHKHNPLSSRNARRPTRAILIGWLLRPWQNRETRRPCACDYRSIPSHLLAVSPGRLVGPALKLDGAQRNVGRLASCFFCSVGFSHFPARTVEKQSFVGLKAK